MEAPPQRPDPAPVTWREAATATTAFAALSILYTWPLLPDFFSSTLWLGLNQALLANASFIAEELAAGSSPLTVERVLWPAGYTVHEGFLPSLTIAVLGGGLAALNFNTLAGFILSGLGAYLVAREVTPFAPAAFVGGAWFTFSPQHFANGGAYPVFPFQWLAFFVFGLLAFRRTGALRWVLVTGAAFVAACLSSWYFGVFAGLVAAAFALFFAGEAGHRRRLATVGAVLAGASILLLPFSPALLLGSSGIVAGGFERIVDGSADLLSFLLPSGFHWAWGTRMYAWQADWLGDLSLQSNTIGLIAAALVGYAILGGAARGRTGLFLLATALFCWVLSLGPYLAIGGLGGWEPGRPIEEIAAIRLPFYWLADLFPFSTTRATARYAIVTNLMLSALLAAGAGALAAKMGSSRARRVLIGGLLIGVLAELWPAWPLVPTRPQERHSFYERLAADSVGGSVLELPFRNNGYRVLYEAAGHRFDVIGGAVDKPFARFANRIDGYPLLRQLRRLGPPPYPGSHRDVTQHRPEEFFADVIAGLDIRYAIVHKWNQNIRSFGDYREPEPAFTAVAEKLRTHFDIDFDDEELLILTPRTVPTDWLFPVIADGFGDVEDHGSYLQRVLLGTRGTIEIHSSAPRKVDLGIQLAVILTPSRQATFTLNEQVIATADLQQRSTEGVFESITISGVELRAGVNVFEISTPTVALTIAEVYGGTDQRPISFLLKEFLVVESDSLSNSESRTPNLE